MGRVDTSKLYFEVTKQLGQVKAYRQFAKQEAQAAFAIAKEKFFDDFDADPITVEIEEGPEKLGSSILPDGYGNLFSFIGFYDDDKPIEELRAFLNHNMKLVNEPVLTTPLRYQFKALYPSEDEIASVTPMPWGTANSWALAVENGIPGFNRYLFDLEREFASSRSGPAVETSEKHVLRSSDFAGQAYLFKKLFPAFAEHLLDQ